MSSNLDDELWPGSPEPGGDSEDFGQLLDEALHQGPSHHAQGETFMGIVVKVTPKGVFMDIGQKTEGLIPLHEFTQPDGSVTVKAGDELECIVDRHADAAEGYLPLSHLKAARMKSWDTLEQAFRSGLLVSGRVTGKTKGGLDVDVGVPAFMPGSQIDVRPYTNPDSLFGHDIAVKIVKLNRRRGNVVVSRKAAMEDEYGNLKHETLAALEEGAVVQGVVKNLTDYGVFIDLGGIDGLLHITEISHGRITHPSEALQVGEQISVKVLKLDREKERISLGLRQVTPDPWASVVERYTPGTPVQGRVVSVTDYGAFVELEPGVEGLIHISEMTWSRRMKHPSKVVKVGDLVPAVVLDAKPEQHRVSLGIKQLEADPWTTVAQRYSIGSVVEGRVRKLIGFGAFIEIEEGIDGLVHVSDMSWTKRIKNPSEALKKGQITQAVILAIDPNNRRLSLGIKQLQPDAWESFFHVHNPGDIVRGRVTRAAKFGVFVELAAGVEGLCHQSETPPMAGRSKDDPALPIGAEMDFKIIKMVESDHKIGLSARAVLEDTERTRFSEYHRQAAAASGDFEGAVREPGEEDGPA
ncbi:MAG: 30S ribosomal protein S1 [Acidobacteria bacterium]|nr:30S ribosomal protein S1 [Acidobacteriota bacterium]